MAPNKHGAMPDYLAVVQPSARWAACMTEPPPPPEARPAAQRFLEENGLRLVLRSHEGPDARWRRADLPSMAAGFTIDHVTPAGRLATVFSAPDYPQFQVRARRAGGPAP